MRGAYHDALHNKANEVVLLISSVFGGLTSAAMQYLRSLAARAAADPTNDGTDYSYARTSRPSYFTHHARALAHAAVAGDADCMLKVMEAARRRMEAELRRASAASVRRAAMLEHLEATVTMENAARRDITPLHEGATSTTGATAVATAAALDGMVRVERERSAAEAVAGPAGAVLELA